MNTRTKNASTRWAKRKITRAGAKKKARAAIWIQRQRGNNALNLSPARNATRRLSSRRTRNMGFETPGLGNLTGFELGCMCLKWRVRGWNRWIGGCNISKTPMGAEIAG